MLYIIYVWHLCSTDPSKCINDHTLRSDMEFCRTSVLKLSDKIVLHFIHGNYCIYCPWQTLTYLYFPYCISLIYFSFTKIRILLYAQIYWLAEFGDVSCLQFIYLRVETLTPTWEDFVGQFCRTILRVKSDKIPCPTWEYDRWYTWRDL
jgi:hypothetical protein